MTDRSNVVSSFTAKGTLIEETYAVLSRWDLERSKRENLDELRARNYVGASSTTWLRDIAKILNRRIEPDVRDRPLIRLAQAGIPLDEWRPILLWHITRDEFLLHDFLQHWLFEAHEEGAFRVRPDQLDPYLVSIAERGGVIEHPWSETTRQRVATGLLKAAADFGLLRGGINKEFATYHLPERSFLYLLHALRDTGLSPAKMINSPEWRMYLLRPADVERELLHLHQFHKLRYDVAGSIVELSLPNRSALEYAEAIAA